MTGPTAPRWQRLADDLAAAGITATVHTQPYPGGVSRSITIRRPSDRALVEIDDQWWRKNADVWIGWEVTVSDREGIVVRHWPLTKKRGDVVAAVRAALTA